MMLLQNHDAECYTKHTISRQVLVPQKLSFSKL